MTPENIKRLPFPLPSEKNSKIFNGLKERVIHITRNIISLLKKELNADYSEEKSRIDDLIFERFNLSETDKKVIDSYLN